MWTVPHRRFCLARGRTGWGLNSEPLFCACSNEGVLGQIYGSVSTKVGEDRHADLFRPNCRGVRKKPALDCKYL